jgi:transcriptional regulator with PAS, ATPase and Fis domain
MPSASEKPSVIFLSHFGLNVEPLPENINLIRGNYEGFTQLFDYVENATCIEEISQVKIENLVKEFGNYHIEKREDRLFIIESGLKKNVAEARRVYLKSETIPFPYNDPRSQEGLVVNPKHGKVTVLTPQIEMNPDRWKEENAVYEVVQEGTLQTGRMQLVFQPGQLFNAPYSRYRFQWTSKKKPSRELPEMAKGNSAIVPLLFDYLRGIRETHRSLLLSSIENKALAEANEKLRTTLQKESDFFGMIGRSEKMQKLLEQSRIIAKTDSTLLIVGETGTGKELLARAIHQLSSRKDQRFYAVNCAALTESLLEAELFGYEKGAFTGALALKKGIFEAAHGGTLFLDEVGEISPAMQAKLLRVLENQEIQRVGGRETIPVDVRLISATNKDLKELVTSGKFRNDLFYRLNVISVTVPPLRERLEDLPLLVDHYLDLFAQKCRKKKPDIVHESLSALTNYAWPGNIRELKNIIERAVVMDRDQKITSEDITLPETDLKSPPKGTGESKSFHDAIEKYKRSMIEEILKKTGGNQTKAAKVLGLQRTYLVRLIRLLKIPTKS